MRSRRKVRLVQKACPRCGAKVMGLTGPLYYGAEVFKKLAGVCDGCITPEERSTLTDPRSVRRF